MNQLARIIDEFEPRHIPKTKYMYNEQSVPRVTEIINKCIHVDSIVKWANSLGFKRQSYTKTLAMAADIGTQCHNSIDSFLDNDSYEAPDDMNINSRFAYESFLKWWNDIHNGMNIIEVIYHEKELICKYFGGTLDGLYLINGKYYLIDYKTSNHITYKYCLQLAAYRYMLREMGIIIDGCIILQLSKNEIYYTEYVLDFSNIFHLNYINDCERAFFSLVFAYYNICKIEGDYKKLQWGGM